MHAICEAPGSKSLGRGFGEDLQIVAWIDRRGDDRIELQKWPGQGPAQRDFGVVGASLFLARRVQCLEPISLRIQYSGKCWFIM